MIIVVATFLYFIFIFPKKNDIAGPSTENFYARNVLALNALYFPSNDYDRAIRIYYASKKLGVFSNVRMDINIEQLYKQHIPNIIDSYISPERTTILVPGIIVEQKIVAHSNDLTSVGVYFATYNRHNRCRVNFDFFSRDKSIYSTSQLCAGLTDGGIHFFSFPPLAGSNKQEYSFRIFLSNSSDGDKVAVYKDRFGQVSYDLGYADYSDYFTESDAEVRMHL